MDLTISNKFNNQLLGRIDVVGEINFSGATPSNAEVASAIAKNLKVKEDLIVVKQILTKFSSQSAKFKAVSYKDPAAKAKFEVATKHLKAQAEKKAKEETEKKAAELEAKQKAEEEAAATAETKETEAPVEAPSEEKS
ncbi:hypothetical protein CL619_04910 [archaeon]|nr:hypothetical protein [archaeon]|tara:strand:- start:3187 stop:3600 length:414 start_codon:yes stop_codon:yes gene_type:complete